MPIPADILSLLSDADALPAEAPQGAYDLDVIPARGPEATAFRPAYKSLPATVLAALLPFAEVHVALANRAPHSRNTVRSTSIMQTVGQFS